VKYFTEALAANVMIERLEREARQAVVSQPGRKSSFFSADVDESRIYVRKDRLEN
jgi:hypothetical protein